MEIVLLCMHDTQTVSDVNVASYANHNMKLTAHSSLVPRVRMCGITYLHPPDMTSRHRDNFIFFVSYF
jgi:hypothetical protein